VPVRRPAEDGREGRPQRRSAASAKQALLILEAQDTAAIGRLGLSDSG
jgi:hypothetical protein